MRSKASNRALLAEVGLAPRGLSREEAAAYINVSTTLWERMVTDGRMPRPKRIDGRCVWDRVAVDKAFAALPDERGESDVQDVWGRTAV